MGTGPISSSASNIQNAITQYQTAYAAYTQDTGFMHSLLEEIINKKGQDGKKISTDQAYMMLIAVFGQMTQVTGDEAGTQSAAQAVGATCSDEMNKMIGDFNTLQTPLPPNPSTLTNPTPEQIKAYNTALASQTTAATDLANGISVLQTVLDQNNALPKGQQWISQSTASSITSALNDFTNMFGDTPSASQIQNQMETWSGIANNIYPPTTGQPSRSEATLQMQTALGHLNTANSAFSSSTTLQGNLLQNKFSQVTTMANAMRDLLQSLLTFARTLVGNLAPK